MKRTQLRSRLLTASLVVLAAVAWFYLAPTRIGGSNAYVITSGISMEPRFHAGDLAIVRATDQYGVGDVVAYHSTLLHITVLHRIIAVDGNRYAFKGDNNNFIDPTRPTRAELIGKLWLQVRHGGKFIVLLHEPPVVVAVLALVGTLLRFGEKRRRRNRRRSGAGGSGRREPVRMTPRDHAALTAYAPTLLVASLAGVMIFLGLGLIAFGRPASTSASGKLPYTQHVDFGYSASAPASPVYPNGTVRTGDPIFLALVHRLRVKVGYRLSADARSKLSGTQEVHLQLNGPSGWSGTIELSPPRRFTGNHFSTQVIVDVPYVKSILRRVQALTGVPADAGYTIAVVPQVQTSGTLAGHPIKASFSPVLSFQLEPLQLQVGGNTGAGTSQTGLSPSQRSSVITAGAAVPNSISVAGHTLSVAVLRWLAMTGLLIAGAAAVALALRASRRGRFEEAARIQAQYGHLIVPIVATADALSWAPFEVNDFKALVRLAESGERLILHHHDDDGETYLVTDEGTVYRYRIRDNRVKWDEWAPAPADPVA